MDIPKKLSKEESAAILQAEIAKLTAQSNIREKDMKALIEEYVSADDNEAPALVKKNIRARMPQALELIDELMATGSDGIKANLAKWLIDRGLAPDDLGGIDAEAAKLVKLLENLQA